MFVINSANIYIFYICHILYLFACSCSLCYKLIKDTKESNGITLIVCDIIAVSTVDS